jgi:hypothetical protein
LSCLKDHGLSAQYKVLTVNSNTMKITTTMTILIWAFVAFTCCNTSHSSKKSDTAFQDTTMTFEASLDTLKQAGFAINPQVQEAMIFDRWKEVLVYHSDPVDALYITLGDATPNRPYLNFSNNCWHFDLESIEGQNSYVRILENLKRISNGDLDFQNISDYCNDNEDNKAWVAFEFNSDKYKWDLKVDDDWADGYLFDKIQDLCKKYNKKSRLTFFPEGQAFVISYLTEEEFNKIKSVTGLKLEWLKVGNGQIY